MRRRINWKAVIILVAAIALLVTGAFFLHRQQVRNNAAALRARADAARDAADLHKEIDYLRQYLGFEPGDDEALARYAMLLADERVAVTPFAKFRAITVLDQVLHRNPGRSAERRMVVDLAMSIRRYREARTHLADFLVPELPKDSEVRALLGRCEDEDGKFAAARKEYEAAIGLPGAKPETYFRLASLLQRESKVLMPATPLPALGMIEVPAVAAQRKEADALLLAADKTIDTMIARNAKDYKAYLKRAEYLRTYGRGADLESLIARYEADLNKAKELAPDDAEVLLALAGLARLRSKPDEARAYLTKGTAKGPKAVKAPLLASLYLALAELETDAGQLSVATAKLREGLTAVPDNLDLLWALANVQVLRDAKEEAAETMKALRRGGMGAAEVGVLTAQLLINDKKWEEAAKALQDTMSILVGGLGANRNNFSGMLALRAGLMLGACQERQGKHDFAHDAYRQVFESIDPRSLVAKTGMARARLNAGRIDEALDEYDGLVGLPGAPAGAWLERARLELQRQGARETPNWARVDDALAAVERRMGRIPVEAIQLRLELLARQGQLTLAHNYLDTLVARLFPPQRPYNPLAGAPVVRLPLYYYVAKAALADVGGDAKTAEKALHLARQAHGDSFVLSIARIHHFSRQKGSREAVDNLSNLRREVDQFGKEDSRRLLLALADAYTRHEKADDAKALWARVARDWPDDLTSRLALFDVALTAGVDAEMDRLIDELKAAEGAEGHWYRHAMVRRLFTQAIKQKGAERAESLNKAKALLDEIKARRRDWAPASVAEGQLAELRGEPRLAVEKYNEARRRGDRGMLVLRRLFALHYALGELKEAQEMLGHLPLENLGGDLGRAAAEVLLVGGDEASIKTAMEEAKRLAEKTPSPQLYVWLGTIYARAKQPKDAEDAFRKATNLDKTSHTAWAALVIFLAETSKVPEAKKALAEAREHLKTKTEALGALALAFEAVGETKNAEDHYKAALKAKPGAGTVRAAAMFYMRQGRVDAATPLLEQLKATPDSAPAEAAWAARLLALLKSGGGTYKQTRAILANLGSADGLGAHPDAKAVGDQRARAAILARQAGRANRAEAIFLLNNLIARKKHTHTDHILLAGLYEKQGQWPLAKDHYERAAGLLKENAPFVLISLARGLLQRGELIEAEETLRRLAKALPPGHLALVELNARLLHKQNKKDAGAQLLEDALKKDKTVGAQVIAAAGLEEMGRTTRAEELYTRAVREVSKTNPRAVDLLIAFYARQKEGKKALDLIEKAAKIDTPVRVAESCLQVVAAMPDDAEVLKRVDGLLTKARAASPKETFLTASLGHLRVLQKRSDEAEALYEEVLKADPDNVVTLNNLAWLLAMQSDKPEKAKKALDLTQKALDRVGPHPWLEDTRAVALLALGKGEEALKVLLDVIEEEPTATNRFHLARAYAMTKNWQAAKDALKKAVEEKLDLHLLERADLEKLKKELGAK